MQTSQLDQLLKFLTETLQQGKDFTVDQAPKFVQELLYWRFYEAVFWCGVGVAIVIAGALAGQFLVGFWKLEPNEKKGYGYDSERRMARWLPMLCGLFLGFVVISNNVYTMVQIKVAPRVVLVEMVRNLVAGQR